MGYFVFYSHCLPGLLTRLPLTKFWDITDALIKTRRHICELLKLFESSFTPLTKREPRPSKLKRSKKRKARGPFKSLQQTLLETFSAFYLGVLMNNLSKTFVRYSRSFQFKIRQQTHSLCKVTERRVQTHTILGRRLHPLPTELSMWIVYHSLKITLSKYFNCKGKVHCPGEI